MPATGTPTELYPTYKFQLRIAGLEVAEFTECAGLEITVKTEEVREGGLNEYHHVLPGRAEYGNLILKRGFAKSNEFFTWCVSVLNRATIQRKDVTVVLVDHASKPVIEWTFLGAYPVKWSGPSFKAGDSAIAIESLELAHRGLQV
jgi:phage tail-like protein